MEIFYICVILVGIFIVCFAMVWMVYEKKKARDYRIDIDERRYELQQMIEDAEQLLTELNNFSSYIVDRLEEKQQNVEEFISKVDKKIEMFSQIEGKVDVIAPVESFEEPAKENSTTSEEDYTDTFPKKKGKLISLDDTKREVIKLYKKGISSTEIARMLNMGKGEIELISRMCR